MPLSENFYNQFAEYRNSIKYTAIPIKKTYDEMLQFLESDGNQHQRDTVDFQIAPPFSTNFLIWYGLQTDLDPPD